MSPTAFRAPRLSRSAGNRVRPLRIGFVPMTDCAPLVTASELGLFAKHGLSVRLCREPGWATVREKMLHGELEASLAPASMVIEMSYGLDVMPVATLTGLVTAHNGNAITLSNELWDLGVRDAYSLRRVVERERQRGARRFTFAGVLTYSSQHYLMRKWLRSGGLQPGVDVDIAILPPPQVHNCLREGHIDGYCVAEPWSSIGLLRGIGWCATLTSDFDPMHPEKVFMVRADFERERHAEHVRLVAALLEACRRCDEPAWRRDLVDVLTRPQFIGAPREVIANALIGPFRMGNDRETCAERAIVFYRDDASRPTEAKARWLLNEIRAHGLSRGLPELPSSEISELFRADIFAEAEALCRDPADPAELSITAIDNVIPRAPSL